MNLYKKFRFLSGGNPDRGHPPYTDSMNAIASFDDLLQAARQQPEPQRLLLLFAGASVDADATPAQRAAFEAGAGGALTPLMCVDKKPEELTGGFAAFAAEADAMLGPTGQAWVLVFAAALSGAVDDARVDAALQRMVESLRQGQVAGFIPFDRQGRAVSLG